LSLASYNALKLVIFLLVVTALVALFVNISPDGDLNSTIQNVQTSVTTIAYAGEISEIQKAVEEFFILRTIHDKEERQLFASKIDERLNKLQLVKIYCDKEISTLELVNEISPYTKLQEICPAMKNVSFSKASELFRHI